MTALTYPTWNWLTDDFWPVTAKPRGFSPAFDVTETDDSFVIEADLPGVDIDDLDLTVHMDKLSISGSRTVSDKRIQSERRSGSFSRSFLVPKGTSYDDVTAEMKDGVLKVTVPKAPEVRPKRLQIKAR